MNPYLDTRALGLDDPSILRRALTSKLVYSIQPAAAVVFDGGGGGEVAKAHGAGVNTLAIDRFDGRL